MEMCTNQSPEMGSERTENIIDQAHDTMAFDAVSSYCFAVVFVLNVCMLMNVALNIETS